MPGILFHLLPYTTKCNCHDLCEWATGCRLSKLAMWKEYPPLLCPASPPPQLNPSLDTCSLPQRQGSPEVRSGPRQKGYWAGRRLWSEAWTCSFVSLSIACLDPFLQGYSGWDRGKDEKKRNAANQENPRSSVLATKLQYPKSRLFHRPVDSSTIVKN